MTKAETELLLIASAAEQEGFGPATAEYVFAPPRRWRFDLAWPALLVAFEREGGTWGKSRHTSGSGYAKDVEKYTRAAINGWCVVRATANQIKSGEALDWLLEALTTRRKK